ncbi:hypothetical protein K437DRAFT_295546 [Tilletiaria anomala UBC 951]|uniref:Uncharacterized protein n=1 Tax=Tilletiaria anomala (strain ATCC 24038 / CBS 436.72 / UBC 951) TaxID=1037660 RepID=A0A066VSX4_TILAU|nr:uncharacterized protein K437DRAFT_295546 [Tilletiaria anomala UBC 951]KDN41685.1 hypothetical protein K437DRAFT_295546 [Tilletiaria anomala UBC 951]
MLPTDDDFDDDDFEFDGEALESVMSMIENAHTATQQMTGAHNQKSPTRNGRSGISQGTSARPAGAFRNAPTTVEQADAILREPLAKRPRLYDPENSFEGNKNSTPAVLDSLKAAVKSTSQFGQRRPLLRKHPVHTPTDFDEIMPEISVREDGQYAIGGTAVQERQNLGVSARGVRQVSPAKPAGPQDQAIIVQNPGLAYRPGMPQLDVFEGDNDAMWKDGAALEQLEEEAISLSQQNQSRPNGTTGGSSIRRDASSASAPSPANCNSNQPKQVNNQSAAAARAAMDLNREASYRRRIEALQKQVETEKERIQKLEQKAKEESYKELGEVMILRQKTQKLETENSELRKRMVEKEDDYKRQMEEERQKSVQSMQQMRTVDAFARFERETSRWPNVTRADVGERHVLHGAAIGLVTPSRRNRDTGPGEGSTARDHSSPRVRTDDDDEMQLDSHSRRQRRRTGDVQPKELVKEFPGLDNSFAAEALEQKQCRSRKPASSSPSTPTKARSPTKALSQVESQKPCYAGDELPAMECTPRHHRKDAALPSMETARLRDPTRIHQWATSQVAAQHIGLVSFMLCHESLPHTRLADIPLTIYHTQADGLALASDPHQSFQDHCPYPKPPESALHSTLTRIVSARLPPGIDSVVLDYHANALDALMQRLMHSPAEVGGRFWQLRTREPYATVEEAESDFWALQNEVKAAAMTELTDALAVPLRQLLGIFVRLCMMDLFNDLLQLCADTCRVFPALTSSLMNQSIHIPHMPELSLLNIHRRRLDGTQALASLDTQARPRNPEATPTNVADIIFEAVKKTWRLPIRVSSPRAYAPGQQHAFCVQSTWSRQTGSTTHANHKDAVLKRCEEMRCLRAYQASEMQHRAEQAWSMGEDVEEEVYEAVLSFLCGMVCQLKTAMGHYTLETIASHPGLTTSFLRPERAAPNLIAALDLLFELSNVEHVWERVMGCQFDTQWQSGIRPALLNSQRPLLDILAKHLVDRRVDLETEDAHAVHVRVIKLLTLLALKHKDARIVIAKSKYLLAALVSCLSVDTTLLWNTRGICDQDAFQAVLLRLSMDLNLMTLLYNDDTEVDGDPVLHDLRTCLDHPHTQAALNGVTHSFIVSLSRIAFAEEPEWIHSLHSLESERRMEAMAEGASSLLELVLSPEELDDVWQLLAGEDEEGGEGVKGNGGQDADMGMTILNVVGKQGVARVRAGSLIDLTQDEETL